MKRPLTEVDAEDEEDVAATTDVSNIPTDGSSSKKKQRSKLNDMSHDFSNREISKLQETEAVFHSSLFRLQISELLKEVCVKQKLRQRIDGAVELLTALIEALPTGKEHKIVDRKWLQKAGIKVPIVETPSSVKGTFQFQPPSEIKVIDSFALNTIVKPNVEANLALQIPKSFFQPKDYLNHRCTRKQALYLAFIASRLVKKTQIANQKFSYLQGNPLKPSLIVTVKGKDSKNVKIHLHTVLESDTFKLSRFDVTKNNIRPKWFFEKSEEEDADPSSLPSTPFYNMSIAYDMCCTVNHDFVEKSLACSEGLRQGIILLKVWLNQRQLLEGLGSFSGELMTYYVVHLVLKKKINKHMNSYQVFKTTLLNLSRSNWQQEPPSLSESVDTTRVQVLTSSFPCVFVDTTGHVNLAYMISNSLLSRVKEEARLSITALDQCHQRSFDVLFMTPMSFPRTFDYVFHVVLDPETLDAAWGKVEKLQTSSMDLGGQRSLALQSYMEDLLSKALETRATLIQAHPLQLKMWDLSDEPHKYDGEKFLTFGIRLNPSGAFSVLNKGPVADSSQAKDFQEFWGNKSEMRRFKDGTIHEAVLWTSSSLQSERRLVCKKIVQHILDRHCGIQKSSLTYVGGQLDSLLQANYIVKDPDSKQGTGEELSLAVNHAFVDVNRAVRSLNSLPLAINSVQGTHPVFRHTEIFPAMPVSSKPPVSKYVANLLVPEEGKTLPPFIPALTVICMLEGSGKWPEDKGAIQCMKALLHVKMGSELRDKHLLPVNIAKTHVDVLKGGFVFRLVLANTREIAVLRTIKAENGMVKFRDTEQAVMLEKETVTLPHHTQLLHGIQQEHPVFSAVVRLCKRWIASQMLWDFISEEALELIVAYTFIAPHPYSPPSSPATGLMRFYHLLSTFNWQADPLMVNLNKEFTENDLTSIPKEFNKNRSSLPSMCIVTPQDKSGSKWTKSLSEFILQRLVVLSRESMKILETQVMSGSLSADFKLIFRPPLQHFDMIINILKKVNVLRHQAVDSKTELPLPSAVDITNPKTHNPLPVLEFNVCRKFFQDLKNCFGEFALFFYDPFGGDNIGMVWRQQASQSMEFKPSCFNYRKPVVDENEKVTLEITQASILEDIRIMGGGIVESIQPTKREI